MEVWEVTGGGARQEGEGRQERRVTRRRGRFMSRPFPRSYMPRDKEPPSAPSTATPHHTPDPISLKCHYTFTCSWDGRDGATMDINANENWAAALCLVSPRPVPSLPHSLTSLPSRHLSPVWTKLIPSHLCLRRSRASFILLPFCLASSYFIFSSQTFPSMTYSI